jgi:hypothetical protein
VETAEATSRAPKESCPAGHRAYLPQDQRLRQRPFQTVVPGYVVYSAPTRVYLGGGWIKVFCCENPDGTVIEFMEFLGR